MMEFQKPSDERDYGLLKTLTNRSSFFNPLPTEIRQQLLRQATINTYRQGITLYEENDDGDDMFLILRGCVSLYKISKNQQGNHVKNLERTINNGQYFGDLGILTAEELHIIQQNKPQLQRLQQIKNLDDLKEQMQIDQIQVDHLNTLQQIRDKIEFEKKQGEISVKYQRQSLKNIKALEQIYVIEKEKFKDQIKPITRSNTAIVSEDSIIFQFNKYLYKNLITHVVGRVMQQKVETLQQLTFFTLLNPYALIPLANLFQIKHYDLNDIILDEGEIPKYFTIVKEGKISVCKKQIIERMKSPSSQSIRPNDSKVPFKFDNRSEIFKKKPLQSIQKRIFEDQQKNKIYDYKLINSKSPDKLAFYQLNEVIRLQRGDFYSKRSLITPMLKSNIEADGSDNYSNIGPCKLSVVAESNGVEIMIIERSQLTFIPEDIKEILMENILKGKDFDDVDVKQILKQSSEWDNYKDKLMRKELSLKAFSRKIQK